MSTQPTVVAGGGENQNNETYQNQFAIAYVKSKPPSWRALYNMMPGGPQVPQLAYADRVTLLKALFAAGARLDPFIEGGGGYVDPLTTMVIRENQGWAWVAPGTGLDTSTQVMGQGNSAPVPAGMIPTSTNIADYPPYPVPVVPVVPAPVEVKAANPVGIRITFNSPTALGDLFRCAVANDGYPTDGTGIWNGTSGTYWGTWTKEALEAGLMIVWVKTA